MPSNPSNGYTILPPGKLANAVTWLEMRAPFSPPGANVRTDLQLVQLTGKNLTRYLAVYTPLAQRWLWDGRLRMAHAALQQMLDEPDIQAHVLCRQGRDVGLLELDFRTPGEAELAYFGIFDDVTGNGAGKWLLRAGLAVVAQRAVRRLIVHTCNFDHPSALGFYRSQGFVPYQVGYEVMDDPRLSGILGRDSAPHVPLIEPSEG